MIFWLDEFSWNKVYVVMYGTDKWYAISKSLGTTVSRQYIVPSFRDMPKRQSLICSQELKVKYKAAIYFDFTNAMWLSVVMHTTLCFANFKCLVSDVL